MDFSNTNYCEDFSDKSFSTFLVVLLIFFNLIYLIMFSTDTNLCQHKILETFLVINCFF